MDVNLRTKAVVALTAKEVTALIDQLEAVGVNASTPLGQLEAALADLDFIE